MSSEYAKQLGAKLRAIRTQQGLSLHGVEEKSQGRWKAVVVGSDFIGLEVAAVARQRGFDVTVESGNENAASLNWRTER